MALGDWVAAQSPRSSTLHIGNAVTKYYYFGGERVAMRRGNDVKYFQSNHLGSATLTTDSNGSVVYQVRYNPYGSKDWDLPKNSTPPTDYNFTGQRLTVSACSTTGCATTTPRWGGTIFAVHTNMISALQEVYHRFTQ